jgi:hypothetical protein
MKNEVNQADLERIEKDLNKIESSIEKAFHQIGEQILTGYRGTAQKTVETGAFLAGIEKREFFGVQSAKEMFIESSVNYEGFPELGTKHFHGRFPAKQALDFIEKTDLVGLITGDELDKILKH